MTEQNPAIVIPRLEIIARRWVIAALQRFDNGRHSSADACVQFALRIATFCKHAQQQQYAYDQFQDFLRQLNADTKEFFQNESANY